MEDLKFKTAEQVMKHTNTPDRNANFYTNGNKGFAMAINGFRISVQWGPGNYVDREIRYGNDYDAPMQHSIWGCDTAEVMIWGRNDEPLFELIPYYLDPEERQYDETYVANGGHMDQVFGNCSSDCVAKMIGCLAHSEDDDPRRALKQIYDASF